MILAHRGHHQHVRAVIVELEPLRHVLSQHGRSKGTERLAILDAKIEHLLHGRAARITQDRACPERAWPKLHAPLHPPDRLLFDERRHRFFDHRLIVEHRKMRPGSRQSRFDVTLGKGRTQIAARHAVEPIGHDARSLEIAVISRQRRP